VVVAVPPAAAPEALASTGTVTVAGDADRVVLTGGDGSRRKAGASIPTGKYAVDVTFPGNVTISGTIAVESGETVTLKCVSAMQRCSGWTASN
jgi:hypothetical protein